MYPSQAPSTHPQSREKWNAERLDAVAEMIERGVIRREQMAFLRKRLADTQDWLYLHPDGQDGWITSNHSPDGLARVQQDDGSWVDSADVTRTTQTVAVLGCAIEVTAALTASGTVTKAQPSAAVPAGRPAQIPLVEGAPTFHPEPLRNFSFVSPDRGLLVMSAAKALLRMGPLRFGMDGQFWAFDGGVWAPGEKLVHARIVQLLGEDYRMSHRGNIRSATETLVPEMFCTPVEQYINFRNGLLDWRTGDFLTHDPAVASTVQLQTEWTQDPPAQCPNFDAFLAQILEPDDVRRVWEIIGYLMMSGNPLQKAFLFKGQGRNGKGALLRTITMILGNDNISNISLHDLADNRFAPAGLFGKTANICGDIDARYVENTGLFKMITGQDTIEAEHKGKTRFRFLAWAVPVFSANGIPGSADTSSGWVDRWEVVHFGMNLSGKEDRSVEEGMQTEEELRGIAAKAVVALRTLQDRGRFEDTESSRKAKQSFQENSNPVAAWLADQERGDQAWTQRTVAWSSFKAWARDARSGEGMSRNRFYEAMRNQGLAETIRGGQRGFAGVMAKEPPSAW